MSKLSLLIFGILGAGVLATGCGDDDDDGGGGEPTTFNVTLTAAAEAPMPCAGAGAGAAGTATITISADNSTVTLTALNFMNLSGPATAAHIHQNVAGMNGPVVLNFGTSLTPPVNAMFTATSYPATPPMGASPDFAAFVTEMKGGKTYVNVHTAACAAGEIRGQIQ